MVVQQLPHEQLSHPCSKGKNERDDKNDYNSPWVKHTWLNVDLRRVTHLLLQLLSCNVGSFSPPHFLGMVLKGCVHNAIKNATKICRMGTTADYADPLKKTHHSSCSINKKDWPHRILSRFHTRCNCSATDEKEFHHLIFLFFKINQSINNKRGMATLLREKTKCHCYALTSALEAALRSSSASSYFRYHHKMQCLLLPCYAHASLWQARYSYQLYIATSLQDILAASAVLFSFWCPFQSYFSPVAICTAGDTFWLPPSVSFSL